MVRELAAAMVLGMTMAGAAAAQQSIGVSAVILERVDAGAVDVAVRSIDGRLGIERVPAERTSGSRLLRATFVSSGTGSVIEETVRIHDGGSVRLERRALHRGGMQGEKMKAGETLFVDAAPQLTVTRVVASNS